MEEIIKVECGQCGKSFQAYKPSNNDANIVDCPYCGNAITIKLNPKEINLGQPAIAKPHKALTGGQHNGQDATGQHTCNCKQKSNNQQAVAEHPEIGKPLAVPSKDHLYIIKDKAITGNTYTLRCPECGHWEAETMQEAETAHKWYCPACKTLVAFNIVDKPKLKEETEKQIKPTTNKEKSGTSKEQEAHTKTHKVNISRKETSMAELVWGGIFSKKHLKLPSGTNIVIGRKDSDEPSNLQMDDAYMSRRSARIEAEAMNNGTRYKFTVLKCSNPVFINSKEITQGSSVYLNYGDTITLGKTIITLKKVR